MIHYNGKYVCIALKDIWYFFLPKNSILLQRLSVALDRRLLPFLHCSKNIHDEKYNNILPVVSPLLIDII